MEGAPQIFIDDRTPAAGRARGATKEQRASPGLRLPGLLRLQSKHDVGQVHLAIDD